MKELFVSLLDCDFLRVGEEMQEAERAGVHNIHIDIMDGHFVDRICIGEAIANRITEEYREMSYEVHLMVEHPARVIDNLEVGNVECVIVHCEAEGVERAMERIRKREVGVGLAISPDTEITEDVKRMARRADKVLVMGVRPGSGGQKMVEGTGDRVRELKREGVAVGVDGGVNEESIGAVAEGDSFVVGSAFFRAGDKKKLVDGLFSALLWQDRARKGD